MTTQGIEELLESLPTVDLARLDAVAGLLVRRDRKYVVPMAGALRLLAEAAPTARVLAVDGRRTFHYESIYFDTADRLSYVAAARGRPRRFKVRTRTYLDSGVCMVEVKVRGRRGETVKERHPYAADRRWELDGPARRFVGAIASTAGVVPDLEPALETRYCRSTLLLPGRARVTIDRDLVGCLADGPQASLTDMVIIETKSPGPPTPADRALWAMGCRPIRLSKYCTSLAVLNPALPANRWTRALGQPWTIGEEPSAARAARSACPRSTHGAGCPRPPGGQSRLPATDGSRSSRAPPPARRSRLHRVTRPTGSRHEDLDTNRHPARGELRVTAIDSGFLNPDPFPHPRASATPCCPHPRPGRTAARP